MRLPSLVRLGGIPDAAMDVAAGPRTGSAAFLFWESVTKSNATGDLLDDGQEAPGRVQDQQAATVAG